MASINGIWGNGYVDNTSYLFNNMSNKTSGSFAAGNILGIDLAEYSSITRGSYSKLLKAYYAKYDTHKESKTSEKEDSTATKTTLKSDANELYKAANALVTNGKNSLFKKGDVKDEESGMTTKGYDKDKIYKAVNSLIDSYNSLVKKSTDSKDNAVLRQTLHMVNATGSNRSLLGDIGVKINEDNTLAIDEETFKKADMNTVKTLFNGADSLGAKIQSAAMNIHLNVNNSLGNDSIYTSAGTLGRYSSGNILDSLL